VSTADRVALVTGASQGLGRAVAAELLWRGWRVVVDARDGARLAEAVAGMPRPEAAVAVPGDVSRPVHRARLAAAVGEAGRLELLVNNASALGPSPPPRLADLPLCELDRVLAVNVAAPLALFQLLLPRLRESGGVVVNVSSDAAVEAYEGWGGYGASKAALDRLSAVAAAEHPELRVYAFDPGDMATDMHQRAFPGEDISDRPSPESVAPALLRLAAGGLRSGRYRAADRAAPVAV
jgi:NAD(P)-dependent dehydrogenase (short-subunit alcohol dehydrogenase family)